MIKRLLLIASVLGLGQIFIIFSLKNISKIVSAETFSSFGQAESNFQFLIVLTAAGVLSDAIRKITQTPEWKQEYLNYQSARSFFSLVILPFSFLFFVHESFLIFLLAPLIAFSGEYAFYGIGKPVLASIIAFVRILIPYGLSIPAARYFPQYYLEIFGLILFITYFLTGLFVSRLLNVQYFIKPGLKAFRLYLTSLKLGLVNILLYIQGLGLMLVIPYLFSEKYEVISIAFIGLKFYAIFKAVIRIIHQALVKEMLQLNYCLTVDKLSMLLGFVFFAAVSIFPETTITLLFGTKFIQASFFFQLLAVACIIFAFCFGLATNAVLMHYDKKLLLICTVSVGLCAGSLLIFKYIFSELNSINAALISGEISLTTGVLLLYTQQNIFKERIIFVLQQAALLAIPLLLKNILFSDSLIGLSMCIGSYSAVLLAVNLKEFNSVKLTKPDY
jgi:hypothetical protein